MRWSRAQIGLMCWVLLLPAARALDIDVPETIPDEPFRIQAGSVEYSNQTFLATGGVTGRFENLVIRADEVSGNRSTGDLHAEGDILVERGDVIWMGSSLDYNFLRQEGTFGPSSLQFAPAYLSVDHVERVSTNEYLLRGATFTTCPKDSPHIHARAQEAQLIDEQYVKARGVVFYVGRVPVFYVPYWRHKLEKGVFTFRLGTGSEWGTYALTRATVPVTGNVDYLADINLYSQRGIGFGQGFAWNYPFAIGGLSAFYLDDQDPNARFDDPDISEDRYRFRLEHLQRFTDTHYLNTKWNYLSDPAVLDEFLKNEHRLAAQPENYASWVFGSRTVGTEAFFSKRVNDFYDNTDRAEFSADLYRMRLGRSPFYLQSENRAAYLERVYAETNTVAEAYDSARLDSANGLYWPQRYGFLNLVPRATYRATYYTRSDITANGGGEELRHIPGAGIEMSFEAARVLSEQARWYGRGLRHRIEPYADYIYENASTTTNRLLQFDEVDRLGDENKVQLGLRNILQTKRDNRVARFIELDLYTYYLLERNGAPEDFDALCIDARMPLTRRTTIDMEGAYDWYSGKVPDFYTRMAYDRDEAVFSLEHFYEQGVRSLWTPRIDLFPTGKTSIEAYVRYDDNANDLQEAALIGYRNFCCMRYGLGYHTYDDGEQRIMFSIGLSAYPEARISSGL